MMKKRGDKKGISPVVATVLLITIAIIVVAIIWIWASRSIGDADTKFTTPIDQACQNLNVQVSVVGTNIDISNHESQFALEGIILKDDSGDLHECPMNEDPFPLAPGASADISTDDCGSPSNVESAIPVLRTDDGNTYNCESNEIDVTS